MFEPSPPSPESGLVPAGAGPELSPVLGAGAFSEMSDEPQQGANLQRYLDAVLRRKWIILAVVAVGTTLGVVGSRFLKPVYEAQATMWVELDDSKSTTNQGPIRSDELLQSTGWLELLRSFVILDEVVRSEQLYLQFPPDVKAAFSTFQLEPRFRPGGYVIDIGPGGRAYTLTTKEGQEVERGKTSGPIGAKAGFHWTPPANTLPRGKQIAFTVLNPRDVAVQLSKNLQSHMQEKGGNFLRLSLQGTDPRQASATVNAVAARFVDVAAELKRSKLEELTSVLDEQRRYAEDNLHNAEMALQSFKVHTITLPSQESTPIAPGLESTQAPVMSRFFDMKVDREQLRSDRESIERVLAQSQAGTLPLDALSMIPAVQSSPALKQALDDWVTKRAELRALQQRYTSAYRPVQQAAEQVQELEKQTIPKLANDLRMQIMARENEMESHIASASTDLQAIPPRALEEARLERQVSIAENLHKTLKQRYEEARLAAAATIPDIRVLDRAIVPTKPVSDPRTMAIFMGLMGSLGLALAGVILVDRLDPRVRYPEQVTGGLGLPILGVVPSVDTKSAKKGETARLHAAESFRELRLNLIHATGTAGPTILTITSPESGDGKSFVTSNLATAFADQGIRTLIIDADTRRGGLHRIFGLTRGPGLTDYLAGRATLQEVVQKTSVPSVFLIGSGTRMHNGPELLSAGGLTKLMMSLRAHFGAILIDTPPLGAGVDAYAVSTVTRDLVLVVRTGNTNRAFAGAKLALLDRLPVRLVGAVLNGTPASGIYHDYSYLPGYDAHDEAEDPEEPAQVAATGMTQLPEPVG